jgi:hypothetical protein
MNKIFFLLLTLFSCFFSCKNIKEIPSAIKVINYALKDQRMSRNTSELYVYQKDKFIFKDQSVFIPCVINGKEDTLLYDSGFSGYVKERVYHDSVFRGTTKIKANTMAFSKSITFIKGLKYYNIKSSWFDFQNYVGEMIFVSTDTIINILSCDKNNNKIDKILGFKSMPKYNQVLMLNFSDTSMALYDSTMIYDTTEYVRIKGTFWDKKFGILATPLIYLTIDSIEYDFVFDIGSQFSLSLASKNHLAHMKEDEIYMDGMLFRDASGRVISDTVVIQKNSYITFADWDDTIEATVMFMNEITHNNMGITFISGFDWIIDKFRDAIYIKPLYRNMIISVKNQEYTVNIVDTSLIISTRILKNNPQLPLFSVIDSVNGKKVTMENICEIKTLLNKKDAFNENEVVILRSIIKTDN